MMNESKKNKANRAKKRILMLANHFVTLHTFRKELIQRLLDEGYEVYLSLPSTPENKKLTEMGCHVIAAEIDRRSINPINDIKILALYMRIIRQIKPDLVITYTIKPNIYGGFVCRLVNNPYAVNITGLGTAFQKEGALRTLVTTMYKVSLRKAKVVFFENCENQQIFIDERIVPKNKTCLLNGAGVNLEKFPYIEYPTDSEPVRFLFIGRVMREKGVNELFKAMRMLRKNGVNCTLDVLGGYEENYEDIIHRFEKEGWLNYHGFQDDIHPFIKNCHCAVLPSWHEGMANTNLECAASGRPVITSNIHGCLEAVVDGKSGFLCEKQNARSLYEAMKKFSELPVEDRAEMGKCGRKHMEMCFDKKKVVHKTIQNLVC